MDRRVAVTGWGCVSGLGQGVAPTWEALLAGRGAIRPIARRVLDDPELAYAGPAAPAVDLDPTPLQAKLGPRPLAGLDPHAAFALIATHEALTQAGLVDHPVLEERTAVVYGGGSGGNATTEEGYGRLFVKRSLNVHPQTVPRQMISAPSSVISMSYGLRGTVFSLASACASSAHAVMEAMHMIRAGRAQVAVTGGTEAALTYGSWTAWAALKAMAPDACRPFSIDRKGMVLGEGAATLVLEDWEHARARGAEILAEVTGAAATSDAHHITAPDGRGAARALRLAHEDAGLPLDTPLLISAHGTGTVLNDRTEAAAMREVYGPALDASLVIATKSAHGHLIGAGGALEFIAGLIALREGAAPPTLGWLGPDPECDVPLVLEPREHQAQALVSNAFAFGGLNAVLVGRRV